MLFYVSIYLLSERECEKSGDVEEEMVRARYIVKDQILNFAISKSVSPV